MADPVAIKCPHCDLALCGGCAECPAPAPGDVAVCGRCGAWLVFAADRSVREYDDAQDGAGITPEMRRELRRATLRALLRGDQ